MTDPFLLQRKNAAELFIVRHGDALPGPDELIPSGVYDDLPLSSIGREQAQLLATRLAPLHFDAMYSSPLRRCRETAAPLAERWGMTPTIVDDIREIRLGDIRPLPNDKQDIASLAKALQERQVDIIRVAGESGNWDSIGNSEPSKAFRQRVVNALDEIAHNHIGERIIAFAHGGVINAYAAEVLGLEKDFFFPAANTSITVVRISGKQRVLFVMNDIAHVNRIS